MNEINLTLGKHSDAAKFVISRMWRSALQSLLSIVAIATIIALPLGLYVLFSNSLQWSHAVASPELSVYFQTDVPRNTVLEVQEKLQLLPEVRSIRLIKHEETLQRMKKLDKLGDVLATLNANPFPDILVIEPNKIEPIALESFAQNLRQQPQVDMVQYDTAWVRKLNALLIIGRTLLELSTILFSLAIMLVVFNSVRLQAYIHGADFFMRSSATEENRLALKRSHIYSGVVLGLCGGLLACFTLAICHSLLVEPVDTLAQVYGFTLTLKPLSFRHALYVVCASSMLGYCGGLLSFVFPPYKEK